LFLHLLPTTDNSRDGIVIDAAASRLRSSSSPGWRRQQKFADCRGDGFRLLQA